MSEFHTYNPRQVSFVFRGIKFSAFADNTFIEVERSSDGWHKHVGANGDVTRTRDLDISGTYTLTLMSQSSDNDEMQTIADLDEATGAGFGPCQVMDHNGNMECHSVYAWIRKLPKIERAKEAGTTQWVIDCADLEINAGGNVTPL
jgi:hypothetical protein